MRDQRKREPCVTEQAMKIKTKENHRQFLVQKREL